VIKAIFFDIDGTLIDTRAYVIHSIAYFLHKRFVPAKIALKIAESCNSLFEFAYKRLAHIDRIANFVQQHFSKNSKKVNQMHLFPHVKTTLEELKERGYLLGIVSTRNHNLIQLSLDQAEILDDFDTIVGFEDTRKHKPHPEPVLKALENLELNPDEAIMVGDMADDMESGKSAGVYTVGVTYGFAHKDMIHLQPNYVINDIVDLLGIVSKSDKNIV
jgi:HAD superfamily hydrolase (TIGR01509 family)